VGVNYENGPAWQDNNYQRDNGIQWGAPWPRVPMSEKSNISPVAHHVTALMLKATDQ